MKRGEFVSRVVLAVVGLCMLFLDIEAVVRAVLPSGFDDYAAGYIAGLSLSKYLVAAGLMVGALGWRWFWRMFMGGDGRGSQRGTTPHLTSPPRGEECEAFGVGAGVAIVVLTVAALVLRTVGLNSSLTYDEAFLVKSLITQNPIRIFLHPSGSAHIFHTLLASLSVRLFGLSEWSIRLPALLMGVLLPAVLYWTVRCVFNPRCGLLAGFLAVFSPLLIWYSQEAKGNGPLMLGVVASWLLLLRLRHRWGRWDMLGYVSALIAVGLSHLSGLLVVLGQMLVVGLMGRWSGSVSSERCSASCGEMARAPDGWRGKVMLAQGVALYVSVLTYSPIVFFLKSAGQSVSQREGGIDVRVLCSELFERFLILDAPVAVRVVAAALVVLGMVLLARRNLFFVALAVAPFVMGVVLMLGAGLFSHARYHMHVIPFVIVAMAAGFEALFVAAQMRLKWLWLMVAGLGVAFLGWGSAVALKGYFSEEKSNYKAVARWLEREWAGPVYVVGPRKSYPAMAMTYYRQDFLSDDDVKSGVVAGSGGASGEVAVVVMDPMCLGVSYPGLTEVLERSGKVLARFECLGELDQYRVRESTVWRLGGSELR